MKKVTVEIEERIRSCGEVKEHNVTRVLRPLGNAGDFYVRFKGAMVVVNKYNDGAWHGVAYG